MKKNRSIYERMVEAGVEIEHHNSDLYVPANGTTNAILGGYQLCRNVVKFKSHIDDQWWYDIPFAYDPWPFE